MNKNKKFVLLLVVICFVFLLLYSEKNIDPPIAVDEFSQPPSPDNNIPDHENSIPAHPVEQHEFRLVAHIPPEEYLCETYAVGGELLPFSEWTCYNGKNEKGEIRATCTYKDDDELATHKVFPDEHYVCVEDVQ